VKFGDMRVCDTGRLKALCQVADDYEFNRRVAWEDIDFDPDGLHVVGVMLHNHTAAIRTGMERPVWPEHHRCQVFIKARGTMDPLPVTLDIPVVLWESLPTPDEILNVQEETHSE
jgi:hypothetical protein